MALGQTDVAGGEVLSSAEVRRAINQLADDSFDVRQHATDELWSMGESAVPALERALQGDDAEVRLRARSVLERFRFGIFVDTPAADVQWINQFRFGGEDDKRRAFQALVKNAKMETLLAIVEAAESPAMRGDLQELVLRRLERNQETKRLLELATRWLNNTPTDSHRRMLEESLRRQVPRLLALQRFEQAESILRKAATGENGMRDWAVYCYLNDRLDREIVAIQESPEATRSDQEQQLLIHFYRVKGDLDRARALADGLTDRSQEVLRGILFEQKDWSSLATILRNLIFHDPLGQGRNIETLGYALACHRLSGDDEHLQLVVEQIRDFAQLRSTAEWNSAEALIINSEIETGIDILRPRMPAVAFQMLAIQERYKEAFELASLANPLDDHTSWFELVAAEISGNSQEASRQFELAVQVVATLYSLGEREAALRYCDILAKAVEHDRSGTRLHEICKVEARLGLWDRAVLRASSILAKGRYPDPLPTLFPRDTDTVRAWWSLYKEQRLGTGTAALNEIGQLMRIKAAGEITQQRLEVLLEQAALQAAAQPDREQGKRLFALSNTCARHGLSDRADRILSKAAELVAEAAMGLGDKKARARDWEQAAFWYRRTWELDNDDYLARYLEGNAVQRRGQPEKGRRLMEHALVLPLADVVARRRLAAGLKERGFVDEAVAQWQLVMRSGGFLVSLSGRFRDTSIVDAAQNVGNALNDEPLTRASYWETMHLSCLEAQLWIPSFRGYFRTPHIMHQTRALTSLKQGRIAETLEELHRSEVFLPANTEFAENVVPRLVEAGLQAEADAIFNRCYDAVDGICAMFPNSALHHNNLAWMSARCDRRLDEALVHVERALELVPDSAAYFDTKGEVHFRRGDVEKAIQCAERCLEIDPRNRFYSDQLARFRAGE
jgi:tetratricopeptide (TPR) repeat protein